MMKRISFALVLIAMLASTARAQIVKVEINDEIHPVTDEMIGRALETARRQHAQAVLIVLNTPGGLVDSTRSIIGKILTSPVPVIIYVAPSGSFAASAGFFILQSADVAAMAPGTNTGAAHPVSVSATGEVQKDDSVMKTKIENDLAAFIRSYVSKRGRNIEVAESAVRESKSWSDSEALQLHLIDLVAANQTELLKKLDGRTITRFDGSKVTLHTANQTIIEEPWTLRLRLLSWLLNPGVAFVVFSIGMLAIYAEFNHPGAIVPGVVGAIMVVLAAYALHLLPTSYIALALILLSFVLFAMDAKFPTHGALTIGGIACLTLGGLLLVDGPIPQMRVKLWTALAVSIPFGLITTFLMTLALRARRQKSMTGPQGLIGTIAIVRTPLSPEGKVLVEGELWNAVAVGDAVIGIGEQVEISGVEGLLLRVRPVAQRRSVTPVVPASR